MAATGVSAMASEAAWADWAEVAAAAKVGRVQRETVGQAAPARDLAAVSAALGGAGAIGRAR